VLRLKKKLARHAAELLPFSLHQREKEKRNIGESLKSSGYPPRVPTWEEREMEFRHVIFPLFILFILPREEHKKGRSHNLWRMEKLSTFTFHAATAAGLVAECWLRRNKEYLRQ